MSVAFGLVPSARADFDFDQLLDPSTWFAVPDADLAGAAAADGTALPYGAVPLQVVETIHGQEPVVDVSIGGGPTVPLVVDTGSAGVIVPIWDLGWQQLAFPTGIGMSEMGGGNYFFYLQIPETVDFGNGLVSNPTTIDAVFFTFPASFTAPLLPAEGLLGIGVNQVGPESEPMTAAMPGNLSDGVLIDEPQHLLQFGPNPLPVRAVVEGAPGAQLTVQFNDGPLQQITAVIDSGGKFGEFPASVIPADVATHLGIGNLQYLDMQTRISVYTADGATLLYSYIPTGFDDDPIVTGGSTLDSYLNSVNTGNILFAQNPVYISNSPSGVGQTIFDQLPQ
ncbi:PecA family PE domain-processing aspartic protease [Mycobacterium sp. M1]|uniref:PecA family PE domain-processing aspartic protease n=1 Tax=Mycolicibacter acidiphilus TaxID=2835306 RepID=A0ABS5RFW6_9MYCO|nr:PecA family PE domain-processing aspartic protease [Mycolicibacter acidiphilus]MBS9532356.1 PecA family PE domain-processing aspartic protease [Mycolicibacter acidiphilus]